MTDIELVIKIPKDTYTYLCNGGNIGASLLIENAIKNGTPLPKGHGRIIDESKITQVEFETIEEEFESILHGTVKHQYRIFKGSDAPTIIKAESEDDNV